MTTVAVPDVDWMRQAAAQLGDALGWPITWTSPDERRVDDESCCEVDVLAHEEVIGRLTLDLPDDPRLDAGFQSAREVTELFADLLSRLATVSRRLDLQAKDMSTLVEVGKTVPRTGDLRSALSHLMRAATQLSGLWSGAFFLYDPRESLLRLRATHQLAANTIPSPQRTADGRSADGRAWEQGAVILDRLNPRDCAWLPPGMSVGICVPIIADRSFIGSLWCFDRRHRALGEWEIQVLQSVAAQITSILERTVLLKESAQQQQIQSELRIASDKLPVGLLHHPPADWGLDMAIRAATVSGVGGDLCDVMPLGHHRTLVAIGDAVGHSVPAAMLVSVARGALRALVTQSAPDRLTTPELMVGINRALHAVTRAEQFVTLAVGILDSRAGTLTYTNAGHPPPLLLRDEAWLSLKSHGLFLGVEPAAAYPASVLPLVAGDVLVWYTDGVTETLNSAKEAFRQQGIQATIPAAGQATADALAEIIWQRLASHAPGRPLRDDRTLLVLKYLGRR